MSNEAEVPKEITEVTRRAILDFMAAWGAGWSGRLTEDAFLSRLYNLSEIPSTDYRFRDAKGDIWQHRVNNFDWADDWIFHDPRFDLLHAPDEEFLRFLCETAHPVVRPKTEEARALVDQYNKELAADGWTLAEGKLISDRPVFVARRAGERTEIFQEPTGWQKVDRQLQEVRLRLETADAEEQFQAVGLLCREVLISVAQEIFDPARHPTVDGILASSTDAKRMLEAIFQVELSGAVNAEARSHAKAALGLAVALQHKRTADFRTAALCAEGTSSVVNMLAVLLGRRSGGN